MPVTIVLQARLRWAVRCRTLSLAVLLAAGPSALPAPAAQQKPAAAARQERNQEKLKSELADDYYKNWLKKDVGYIITPEERDVFVKLQTGEEKDQFIQQFWQRRDPDPATNANEFKEEHYRRIQYAIDVFAAGIPGWMTDRGRIYIKFGPPNRIETHPAGGPYQRPGQEGGGSTSTYPFERWEYRHLEGLGDDIEIEFVDYSGGNLYKLAKSPLEKDEFLHIPWVGMTDAEMDSNRDAAQLRWMRTSGIRDAGVADSMGIRGEMSKYTPFARAELAANLGKPPVIHFKDLQAAITARVTYNLIPFSAHTSYLRLVGDSVLSPLTLQIPNTAVTFESRGEIHVSRLQIYGRVIGLTGNTIFEFDDEILQELNEAQFTAQRFSTALYHRQLRLYPGRFKMQLLLKDAVSDKMGMVEQGLSVPSFPEGKLAASPVILCSELIPAADEELLKDAYTFGKLRIRPRLDAIFHQGEYLGIYFEIYNAAIDQGKGKSVLKVEYSLESGGKSMPFRDVSRSILAERDSASMPLFVDIASRPPGQHTITFRITDLVQNVTVEARSSFRIAQ